MPTFHCIDCCGEEFPCIFTIKEGDQDSNNMPSICPLNNKKMDIANWIEGMP